MNDIVFGYHEDREGRKDLLLKGIDRRQHLYVLGASGTGKTTLLENLAIQDIQAGKGVAFFDPHGEAAGRLLELIPRSRTNDVVYVSPLEELGVIGLNLLEAETEAEKHRAAVALVSVLRHLWADSWGPRLEWVLFCAVRSLMEYESGYQRANLMSVFQLLVDDQFREEVVKKVKVKAIRWYWQTFNAYSERFASEVITPVVGKVGQLIADPHIESVVSAYRSSVDFSQVLSQGKIVIASLPKGGLGEEAGRLLGGLLVSKLYLSALAGAVADGEDYYLYLDEFQNFATGGFLQMLPELRKYGLGVILAHQYLDQLDDSLYRAIMGNIPNKLIFMVGAVDAERLSQHFGLGIKAEDLTDQGNFRAYYMMMVNGCLEKTLFGCSLYPPCRCRGDEARRETVMRTAYERYGRKLRGWQKKVS